MEEEIANGDLANAKANSADSDSMHFTCTIEEKIEALLRNSFGRFDRERDGTSVS